MKTNRLSLTIALATALCPALVSAQNLFVSCRDGNIYDFNTNGVRSTFATGLGSPEGLAFDCAGNLFAAGFQGTVGGSNYIYKFTLDGTRSTVVFAPASTSYFSGLAIDSTGNLFVAEEAGQGHIYEITTNGTQSVFAAGLDYPRDLAFNSAGSLFVQDSSGAGGTVYEFTPDGTQSTFVSGTGSGSYLAFDYASNLFVAAGGTGNIYEFTTNAEPSTFAIGYGAMAFDSKSNLFVTGTEIPLGGGDLSNYVYELAPDGTRSTFASLPAKWAYIAIQCAAASMNTHAAITVTNIAQGCCANHSLFLESDGSLWVMGLDADGSFIGTTNRPEEIMASNVTAIAAGGNYSLFVKSDGSLWGMGDKGHGQLGFPASPGGIYPPGEIASNSVVAVAAGYAHTLFLKSDGSLWGMGNDTFGQLGDGMYYGEVPYGPDQPEEIVASGVTAIAAGWGHSLFLKSDGSLWAMGWGAFGQLGDSNPFYLQLGMNSPYRTNQPEQIVASNVIAIAAGGGHSLFLRSDGSLWGMGENDNGQLGDGTYNSTNQPELIVASNVTAIATGGFHSLFLKSDGSLWTMGNCQYGQLGDGNSGNEQSIFIRTNSPEQIVASNVIAIAAGQYHSLFIKSDGSLWGMGDSHYGQLGDGFNEYLSDGTPSPEQSPGPEQILPSPRPVLEQIVSNTDLQFTATCDFGGNFYLLGSTDLSLPLNQWTPLLTNSVTTRGTNNFSATLFNAANSGNQQFYILQSQ